MIELSFLKLFFFTDSLKYQHVLASRQNNSRPESRMNILDRHLDKTIEECLAESTILKD